MDRCINIVIAIPVVLVIIINRTLQKGFFYPGWGMITMKLYFIYPIKHRNVPRRMKRIPNVVEQTLDMTP